MFEFFAIALQLVGSMMKADAMKQHGDYVKKISNLNADFTDRAAADAVQRAQLVELRTQMHGSAVIAAQRVSQSASGADVNIGSNRDVQVGTEAITKLDVQTIQRNATLDAYGLRAKSQAYRQQGEYAELEGENAAQGEFLAGIAGAFKSYAPIAADKGNS
jgi:hypothetical protein